MVYVPPNTGHIIAGMPLGRYGDRISSYRAVPGRRCRNGYDLVQRIAADQRTRHNSRRKSSNLLAIGTRLIMGFYDNAAPLHWVRRYTPDGARVIIIGGGCFCK